MSRVSQCTVNMLDWGLLWHRSPHMAFLWSFLFFCCSISSGGTSSSWGLLRRLHRLPRQDLGMYLYPPPDWIPQSDPQMLWKVCGPCELTRWSLKGAERGRPQTRGWFPLRTLPPGWRDDVRRTWRPITNCKTQVKQLTWSRLILFTRIKWSVLMYNSNKKSF